MEENKVDILKEVTGQESLASDDLLDTTLIKKDKKTQLNELIELGRTKGKLTTQEILDQSADKPDIVLQDAGALLSVL